MPSIPERPAPSSREQLADAAEAMAFDRPGELLRRMLASVRDFCIFATDTERRVTVGNSGAEQLFGYSEAEMLGQPADIIFTPEDRATGAPERETGAAPQKGRGEDERWHLRKDGSRFYASGVVTPLRDDAGVLRGFCKVARDLTAQHEAQGHEEFFSRLSEALRPLRDPQEILWQVVCLTGEELRASSCLFGEVDAAQENLTIHRDWTRGVPSIAGTLHLDSFGPEIIAQLRR